MNGRFRVPTDVRDRMLARFARRRIFAMVGTLLGVAGLGVALFLVLREYAASGRGKCARAYAVARNLADTLRVDTMHIGNGSPEITGERPQPSCGQLRNAP
jgi:hypothetical protein